jgi:uncharacterized protein with PIN domain
MDVCHHTGKLCHPTRQEAENGIRAAGYPKHASAYKCPHCGAWHWGKRLRSATKKPRVVEPAMEDFADE